MTVQWAYLADPDPVEGLEQLSVEAQRIALYLEREEGLYYKRDYTMNQKETILEIVPKAKSLHPIMEKAVLALVDLRLFGKEIRAALVRDNEFHSHRVRFTPL